MILRENDIYSFSFNDEELKKRFMPYHCFDGQLVVRKNYKDELILIDTYWLHGKNWEYVPSDCGKRFTLEDALKLGKLTYKCNLNEVEEINEYDRKYYNDSDIFDLSYQHGCYDFYVKRIGAKRDKDKMLVELNREIEKLYSDIEYQQRELRRMEDKYEILVETEDIDNFYF